MSRETIFRSVTSLQKYFRLTNLLGEQNYMVMKDFRINITNIPDLLLLLLNYTHYTMKFNPMGLTISAKFKLQSQTTKIFRLSWKFMWILYIFNAILCESSTQMKENKDNLFCCICTRYTRSKKALLFTHAYWNAFVYFLLKKI